MEYQPRVSNPPKAANLAERVYKTPLNTCSDWQLWRLLSNTEGGIRTHNIPILSRTPLPIGLLRQSRSGGIRTHPVWILSPLPLPLGYTPLNQDNHSIYH